MNSQPQGNAARAYIKEVLGYLNFSSGAPDPRFLRDLNSLYTILARGDTSAFSHDCEGHTRRKPSREEAGVPLWRRLQATLCESLEELKASSEAFKHSEQAETVLHLVFDELLPEYREFHKDLLFHQREDTLFQPFFIGRACEAVLSEGGPWEETDRIISRALRHLNVLLGYRPIPVLEGQEKHQAYPHEFVAPIPLYIAGAGVAYGRYQSLIEKALEILRSTDPEILHDAWFDPDKLDELALDPRAYDFDHPVNRRPNYLFGMWDPHHIDNSGYYRRFVLQQVTLDGILCRIQTAYTGESEASVVPPEDLIFEAAATLVGTMLMGSGMSGDTPQTHDSSTSLGSLLPRIANYRDQFYKRLLEKVPPGMRIRLQNEAKRLQQPFGGARQDLNRRLAKRRADQMQRFHLGRTYARMGYADAARKQSNIISVASARFLCKMDCMITQSHLAIDQDDLPTASDLLPAIETLLHRGIRCGALVDPWNILGFGAQFSLFPAIENTIHDHRVDTLIFLMNDIFDLYSRLQKEAAAAGHSDLQSDLSDRMSELAGWWDQFGSIEVSGIEGFSADAAWESAAMVSTALAAWHQAGTASGDIAFWSRHVHRFKSPKAFVLLGEALLEQEDPVASMALMMHWLSQSEEIPLTEGDYSFHSIALRWMELVWDHDGEKKEISGDPPASAQKGKPSALPETTDTRWKLTPKFFDFLEANADHYWEVPELELEFETEYFIEEEEEMEGEEEEEDGIDPLYRSAYEDMIFRDTADDGFEDDLLEGGSHWLEDADEMELAEETDRISDRLAFLITVLKLWKFSAGRTTGDQLAAETEELKEMTGELRRGWLRQCRRWWKNLKELLGIVAAYKVPPARGTPDSLMAYDRHYETKEILLDRIIWTGVEIGDTILVIQASLADEKPVCLIAPWQESVLKTLAAMFQNDPKEVKRLWPEMLEILSRETLLFVPNSRGGDPQSIVTCRCLQQVILRMLDYAPRLGLLTETFQLLETIHQMEQLHPVRPGAISEFDRFFETACRGIGTCLAESASNWRFPKSATLSRDEVIDEVLVDYMERAIELLLTSWFSHSRQIRISSLETVADRRTWEEIRAFIQRYGHDIFTQSFLGFSNIRAVLRQGVDSFLQSLETMLEEDGELEMATLLIEDLRNGYLDRQTAVFSLEIIFQAIAENYSEYLDYNSTTTQSDDGEKLYMLLDLLRVQTGYDTVSWNLKPVYWVHDAMIRCGRNRAASLWERAVARRTTNAAEEHLGYFHKLSEKYALWLPSIHERLQERFVRPLQIDRMCGLVPKAVHEVRKPGPKEAFAELEKQIELFAREPMAVGFELPEWLTALQEEVLATRIDKSEEEGKKNHFDTSPPLPQIRLTRKEIEHQLEQWARQAKFS